MIAIQVRVEQGELDALAARVRASIRHLGNRRFLADLEELLIRENEYHALRGLNRYGRPATPWRVRRGRSDYSGRDYRTWSDRAVLVPFGRSSRRIDAYRVEVRRRSIAGVGFGGVTVAAGFDGRAGLVPAFWGRRDPSRDVLGLPPRTQRAVSLLCTRHATAAHRLLRRGAAGVARSAASFLG